jgi:acetyltransferase-like isoleucine patch superfamily enzyme
MQSKMGRLFQRYAVPAFAVSLYHLFKSRAILSPSARIQLSRRIQIGRGTVVKPYVVVQSTAGIIRLGRNCALSSFDHLSTGEGDIIIGDFVRIAPNCTLIGGMRNLQLHDQK